MDRKTFKHSISIKRSRSKFKIDSSSNYSPRRHNFLLKKIHSIKNKRYFPQIIQEKLENYNINSPCNLRIPYYLKNLKLSAENRKNRSSSSSVMKYGSSYSPKNKHISLKKIEDDIRKKIFNLTMRIDLEENNSEIENNFQAKIFSNNYKKFENENKLNKLFRKKSASENNNSPSQGNSDVLSPAKNSKLKSSSSLSKYFKKQKEEKIKDKDIYRIIERKKLIYDSIEDDEDYLTNFNEGYYIPINSSFLLIFDFIVIICTLFDIIYTPYNLSNIKCFCDDISNVVKYIYCFIDIIYILDILLGSFRSYYNFELKIITKNVDIMRHYLLSQFFLDFFQALPFFSYIRFICNKTNENCFKYNGTLTQSILLLCRYLKQLKIYKILDSMKNSVTFNFQSKIIEKHYKTNEAYGHLKWILICFFCIYNFISIHIFIGHQSYPNWIVHSGSENKNIGSLYLYSFYFLMTTLTTVGYGDIVCISTIETFFQILFLTVGVSIYSWIVSNIGNYVKNQDRAAVKLNEDENLLEEIRRSNPNMPFKLYNNILQHLKSRKLRQQKCDTNILINNLPYSLRNHLLFTMHSQIIKNFKIFKNCQNTDFILKILTNFIPLFSKKNAILIYEGQLIENIVFIKEGHCSLEASIDLESPEESIHKYYTIKFKDIIDFSENNDSNNESSIFNSTINPQNNVNFIQDKLEDVLNNNKSIITSEVDESKFEREIGKCDFGGDFEESNYQFIHIINILKNENYGTVYMLLGKTSPLSLRLKSKKGELFLLRKFDVYTLCKNYPNIWKRQYKKEYSNMIEIKNKTINAIKKYCESNGIKPKKEKLKSSTIANDLACDLKEEKNSIDKNNNINNINNTNIEDNLKKLTEDINKSKQQELDINKNINININKIITKEGNKKLKISSKSNIMSIDPKKTNESIYNFSSLTGDESKKKNIDNSSNNSCDFIFNNFIKKDIKNDDIIKNITTFNSKKPIKKFLSSESVTFKSFLRGDSNISPSKKNVRAIRIAYIKKLKQKLNKYKKAKKYYKNLYLKKLNKSTNFENHSDKKLYNKLSTNNILDDISSNSSSRSSNLNSISQEKIKSFNNNEISISFNIEFSIKSKYQNLNNFTFGEYAKNKNLRKNIKEFITNYINFEKFQKCKDYNNTIKKYSHSASPKKSSSLPTLGFFNSSSNISQNSFEQFVNKKKKKKNKNYINNKNSNINLNNNINNNCKYYINYIPPINIKKYNHNLKFRSVPHMKSSKNKVNSRVNFSSLRFFNSNKRKINDYYLQQIFDENKYYNINQNIKKCMSNNLKNYYKNLITLKNNENNSIKKNLTYEEGEIISGSNINYKYNKKNNREFFNNLFMSDDENNKNNNNCLIT